MININIIIIGAKSYSNDFDEHRFSSWNNIKQANYYDLCIFKDYLINKNYDVKITCLDGGYPDYYHDNLPIKYIKQYFTLGNKELLDINSHNIFIEFCNLLNENFLTSIDNTQQQNIMNYKEYKLSWISCGCCWNSNFPSDLIETIIENEYFTPIDAFSIDSFMTTIGLTQTFIDKKKEKSMAPFSQGIYQILGTLMWRGYTKDYSSENILHDLIKLLNYDVICYLPYYTDIEKFINKELHWNMLKRDTKLSFTKFIYGSNIIV